ncbi:MAG TPA: hypothetical protein VF251_08240, partial [Pyrinomonadaceae bacterium]
MRQPTSRKLLAMSRVFCSVLLCCVISTAVFADGQDMAPTLEGTWRVTVLPGTPSQFFSLMQFNKDGTMTEEASSPSHTTSIGVWKKTQGHDFAATFELFSDGNGDGLFDTRLRVRLTIHVVDADSMTGTSTIDVLTLD